MNENVTIESLEGATEDTPPSPTRRSRRAAARRALARRALACTAGLAVASAVLALVALPNASKPTEPLRLPSGAAANAAFLTGLLSSTSTTSAAASSAVTPSSAVQVSIQNYAFSPAALTVAVGTTVTWTNKDAAPHTVTVSSGPVTFASPTLQTGDTYTFTFTTPGTYSYYCAVHPSMTASVVVTGSPTTPPTTTSGMPTTSSSMSMPPTTNSTCAVSSGLQVLLTHINSAHLGESPGQQVSDILNVDQYVGNHLVLVQRILAPLTGGGLTNALSGLLQTFLTHVNSAHLDESPAQQVSDILNVNTYIGNHLALIQHMLSSTESLAC